jgi:aspartyl-tRNA(Asn)/glutamyl-tRNA(Gln) amidotransferase subunit A
LGFSPDLGYARVAPEIARSVAAAVERFTALGAAVEEVEPIFPSPREALMALWGAGAVRIVGAYPPAGRALADPGLLAVARAGQALSAADYVAADMARGELARRMAHFHRTYDLLLTPMMPIAALKAGQNLDDPAVEREWIDWSPFSYPFNLTRQPAASICCGLTAGGLPIGLQIVGPLYEDARVLRAARAFETTEPARRPPIE